MRLWDFSFIHVKTKNKICAAVLVFVLAGSLTAGACAVPNVYAKTDVYKRQAHTQEQIPFTQIVDVPGMKGHMEDISYEIEPAIDRKSVV